MLRGITTLKFKISLFLILILLLLPSSTAIDQYPPGNLIGRNVWGIYNFTTITAQNWLYPNGTSILSGLGGGGSEQTTADNIFLYLTGYQVTLNQTRLNNTIDARIPAFTDTNDTGLYYTKSEFNTQNTTLVKQGDQNRTLVSCSNLTGASSNLCTLTDTNSGGTVTNVIGGYGINVSSGTSTPTVTVNRTLLDTIYYLASNPNGYISSYVDTNDTARVNSLNATLIVQIARIDSINSSLLVQITRIDNVNSSLVTQTARIDSVNASDLLKLSTASAISTFVNRTDWTTIDNYPTACSAGTFVQGIGDSLTCVSASGGSGMTSFNVSNRTSTIAVGNNTVVNFTGGTGIRVQLVGTEFTITNTVTDTDTNDTTAVNNLIARVNSVNSSLITQTARVDSINSSVITQTARIDTLNSTKLNIADAITTYVNRSKWTTIDDYPAACSAGQYATQIGDTLTCSTPSGTSKDWGRNDTDIINQSSNLAFNWTTLLIKLLPQTGFDGANITSGTIADARIASTITRDSEVPSLETDSITTPKVLYLNATKASVGSIECSGTDKLTNVTLTNTSVSGVCSTDLNSGGSADGTGGWSNTTTYTTTVLNVNITGNTTLGSGNQVLSTTSNGVNVTNLLLNDVLGCTEALQTYANGSVYCGTDETGAGSSDGTGGWSNTSVYTTTNLLVNITGNITSRGNYLKMRSDTEGLLWIDMNSVDGVTAVRATESNGYQGIYMKYNSTSNVPSIGVHTAADALLTSDIDAITIGRSSALVTVLNNFSVTKNITLSNYVSCTALETDSNGLLNCGSDDSSASVDGTGGWINTTINTTTVLNVSAPNLFVGSGYVQDGGSCPNRPLVSVENRTLNVPSVYPTIASAVCEIPYFLRHRYSISVDPATYVGNEDVKVSQVFGTKDVAYGGGQLRFIGGSSGNYVKVNSFFFSGITGNANPKIQYYNVTGWSSEYSSPNGCQICMFGVQQFDIYDTVLGSTWDNRNATHGILAYGGSKGKLAKIKIENSSWFGVSVKQGSQIWIRDEGIEGFSKAIAFGVSIGDIYVHDETGGNNTLKGGSTLSNYVTDQGLLYLSDNANGVNQSAFGIDRLPDLDEVTFHELSTAYRDTASRGFRLWQDETLNELKLEAKSGDSTFNTIFNVSRANLDFNIFSKVSVTNLTVKNLTAANCDVKADTTGVLYCGTDANTGGSADGSGGWVNTTTYTQTGLTVNISTADVTTLRLESSGGLRRPTLEFFRGNSFTGYSFYAHGGNFFFNQSLGAVNNTVLYFADNSGGIGFRTTSLPTGYAFNMLGNNYLDGNINVTKNATIQGNLYVFNTTFNGTDGNIYRNGVKAIQFNATCVTLFSPNGAARSEVCN